MTENIQLVKITPNSSNSSKENKERKETFPFGLETPHKPDCASVNQPLSRFTVNSDSGGNWLTFDP